MVKITYHESNDVLNKVQTNKFSEPNYFKLNYLANKLLLKGRREDLMTFNEIKEKITLFPHQVNTALKYLNEMNGRMLIADEVGMGKTIEAGIILKELLEREEIKKILILCPSSLTLQWQQEMLDKFKLSFELNNSVHHWSMHNLIIASMDTAKKDKHIQEIKNTKFDLLVVDEAHKLKNKNTQAYKSFQEITANNKLFLTATPLQNNLLDLFNIIELLDKGYLASSQHEFSVKYISDKTLNASKRQELKEKLKGIMVRSTRKETGLEFTKRNVITTLIKESENEAEFSEIALSFIQQEYAIYEKEENKLKGVGTLQLMTLARALTSCRYAFSKSFKKYLDNHVTDPIRRQEGERLLELNERLSETEKFKKTIELVNKTKDKVIIFTQFLTSQSELADKLTKEGHKVDLIRGGMTVEEKNLAKINLKNGKVDVLICTESGSEGLNLQFCHNLINYDLPWNPMRVEQRIGRIHRIGQEYDVNVYNLSIKGTIEEYILMKLYEKIDLFHTAIGDMADIITEVVDEESFDTTIFEILMKSKQKIDTKKKMDELFEKIRKSKEFHNNIKKLDEKTLDIFNLSPIQNETNPN